MLANSPARLAVMARMRKVTIVRGYSSFVGTGP